MKTVTGAINSIDSVSLAKATSILSKFASTENGASQAVGAYLRRASAAFNELKNVHKELRVHKSDKRSRSDVISDHDDLTRIDNEPSPLSDFTRVKVARKEKKRDKNGYLEEQAIVEKEKKNKKTNTVAESTDDKIDEKAEHLQNGLEREEGKKDDKKKKRKDEEVGSEERKSKKKKRQANE